MGKSKQLKNIKTICIEAKAKFLDPDYSIEEKASKLQMNIKQDRHRQSNRGGWAGRQKEKRTTDKQTN